MARLPSPSTLRTVAVVALLFVPVTVLRGGDDGYTVVTLWGFLNTEPLDPAQSVHLYPLWTFFADQPRGFGSLPGSVQAWPLALGFHLLAAGSALSGRLLDREDPTLTAGLLVLGALASLWVAVGIASRYGVGITTGWFAVLPVATVVTLAVVAAGYRRALRSALPA